MTFSYKEELTLCSHWFIFCINLFITVWSSRFSLYSMSDNSLQHYFYFQIVPDLLNGSTFQCVPLFCRQFPIIVCTLLYLLAQNNSLGLFHIFPCIVMELVSSPGNLFKSSLLRHNLHTIKFNILNAILKSFLSRQVFLYLLAFNLLLSSSAPGDN